MGITDRIIWNNFKKLITLNAFWGGFLGLYYKLKQPYVVWRVKTFNFFCSINLTFILYKLIAKAMRNILIQFLYLSCHFRLSVWSYYHHWTTLLIIHLIQFFRWFSSIFFISRWTYQTHFIAMIIILIILFITRIKWLNSNRSLILI